MFNATRGTIPFANACFRRNQECVGQGVGNFLSGIFGAMGGCTTIGQSIMNIHNGGTTRLSAVSASIFMLLIILVAYPLINKIPTSALVGVMFVICYHTIEWSSVRVLASTSLPAKWRTSIAAGGKMNSEAKVNRSDALVVVIVMAVTLYMDLAVAVVVGIVVSSLIFSWNSGNTLTVERFITKADTGEEIATYEVSGSLFFASTQPFSESFTERDDPKNVMVNFDNCDIYDWSAIEAINSLNEKYDELDKVVQFRQIKLSSRRILAKARLLLKEKVSIATFVEGETFEPSKPNKIGSGWRERGNTAKTE